jgi:8-oxo-dGTP diphosphatase
MNQRPTFSPHQIQNRTVYVLGFAFSHSMRSVVLILKKKPAWQAGKLNGVGGKVEASESPRSAMAREFQEETGVVTKPDDWLLFEVMQFQNGAIVYSYAAQMPEGTVAQTMEEEEVDAYPVTEFGELGFELPIISNLQWLIPKAFHQLKEEPLERMIVR